MTQKEAETIAWQLFMIADDVENVIGVDKAMIVANTAIDAVHHILKKYPRIKREFQLLKSTNDDR